MKKEIILIVCLILMTVGHAGAGLISTRADLNSTLASSSGWEAKTEGFENLNLGGSATVFKTTLDSSTVIGSYGPGLVMLGITFKSDAFNVVKAGTTPLFLSSNALGGQLATNSLPMTGTPWLEINFAGQTNAFGFDWRTVNQYGFQHATIKVYHDSILLYDSGTIAALSGFFGYTDTNLINKVLITTTNPDGWYIAGALIDNVTFGAVAVTPPGPSPTPEPLTMLLLGLGLAGLAGLRRRFEK